MHLLTSLLFYRTETMYGDYGRYSPHVLRFLVAIAAIIPYNHRI